MPVESRNGRVVLELMADIPRNRFTPQVTSDDRKEGISRGDSAVGNDSNPTFAWSLGSEEAGCLTSWGALSLYSSSQPASSGCLPRCTFDGLGNARNESFWLILNQSDVIPHSCAKIQRLSIRMNHYYSEDEDKTVAFGYK
ncbi:hypothetical protein CEP54_007184 [Fusarium duplospermum]|uniref:Uncharacterized protein n=1 Tax=Fusarium duplospermum TaxID=1325734 RepID=A0A428Q2Y9_9HYPO|nr:hypothetical protein CEP54_007184 [Fusarium duplospermum]